MCGMKCGYSRGVAHTSSWLQPRTQVGTVDPGTLLRMQPAQSSVWRVPMGSVSQMCNVHAALILKRQVERHM